MKASIFITTIIMAMLLIAGCQKGSNSTTGIYYMKATIGTSSFSASGLSKVYQSSSFSGGLNYTYITGKADNGQAIKFILTNSSGIPLGLSTIPLNSGSAAADYYPKGIDSLYSYAVSGSITITTLTPNISGTFNFICSDSTQVTNGSFSVLPEQ